MCIQWNPALKTHTFGDQCFGPYTEVAFVEGLFCKLFIWDLGAWLQLAFLQGVALWIYSYVVLYNILAIALYSIYKRVIKVMQSLLCYNNTFA